MARVCMVVYTNYPSDTRVRREAEALVQRGDVVDVVCPQTPKLDGRRDMAGVSIHTVGSNYSRGARPVDYVKRYLPFVASSTLKVMRLHLRRRYDVIQVHTMPDFLVFSALGPKLLGTPVVLDVHDLMPELYASKFKIGDSHWAIRVIKAVERWSIGFADRAIAVHDPQRRTLAGRVEDGRKFSVVMNLPDPALFTPRVEAPRSDKFTLIYHGMVGSRHGLDVAVRAVAKARREVRELELQVVGDGDYFPAVRELVHELGVEGHVRLEQGYVPVEELVPVIKQASVGIVPLLDDPFTRYMLPVKLLEYLAVGVPVIASGTETIRAFFDERTVALSTPGDPDDLAGRIVELYRDVPKREALTAAARAFSAEHSWEREREKYYRLIDSLVTRAPSNAPAPVLTTPTEGMLSMPKEGIL
jgi:glycosyltransferase involved in cell wall biosynthesis